MAYVEVDGVQGAEVRGEAALLAAAGRLLNHLLQL